MATVTFHVVLAVKFVREANLLLQSKAKLVTNCEPVAKVDAG